MPNPNIFLQNPASVAAAAAAVIPNGIKTLLAIQFLVMVLKVYLNVLLIVLFYAIEFYIIL